MTPAVTASSSTVLRVVRNSSTTRRAGVLERAFTFVALFLSTGGFLPLLRIERGVAPDDLEGDPVMQIVWLTVYGITVVLLARRPKEALRLLGRETWIVMLCAFVAASVMWSVAPGVTFRRMVALLGTTGVGVYLASRYTAHELLRLACWVLGAAALFSLVFVAVVPNHGIDDDGAWRGIFPHKNAMGRMMALAVVTLLFRLRQRQLSSRLVTLAMLALSTAALLGSHSAAGLVTAVLVAISIPVWLIFRLRSALAIACGLFALVIITSAALWIATSPEVVVAALGKDATLTGRTGLWVLAIDAITSRPWVGHGYAAFWLGLEGESTTIWNALTWQPAHAHNGFLDLALELGLVGVGLFVVGFFSAFCRALSVIRRTPGAYGAWPAVFLLFMLVVNLAESAILLRNSIFWMLYVVTCVWLIESRADRRTDAG